MIVTRQAIACSPIAVIVAIASFASFARSALGQDELHFVSSRTDGVVYSVDDVNGDGDALDVGDVLI